MSGAPQAPDSSYHGNTVPTPPPESRQRPSKDHAPPRGEVAPSTVKGQSFEAPPPPFFAGREAPTEPAPPSHDSRLLDATRARFSSQTSISPENGLGYYSWSQRERENPSGGRAAVREEEVFIPPPPRLPQLDLDHFTSSPAPRVKPKAADHQTTVPRQSSTSRRPSQAPPRIYFSPHVRRQAEMWASTGSLSLPGCSSPRHARAVQRALLLALLTEPGYDSLPHGLQQRIGWLFSEGWESSEVGHQLRELDDLAIVLSLPPGRDSRELLTQAVVAVLPDPLPGAKPSSSRRSSSPRI